MRGYVVGHRDGYGWVYPDRCFDKEGNIFLSHSQMRVLIHGDYVLVQPTKTRGGRREGKVIQVLKERTEEIIGTFFRRQNNSCVIPRDSRVNCTILIPNKKKSTALTGEMVVVKITARSRRPRKISILGAVVEVLGENTAVGIETSISMQAHQIPHKWPEQVLRQINRLNDFVPEAAKDGRVDLRELPLITIDNEDAHDLDDAVYCENKQEGGWQLWVAIADVSYYVGPNTALDKEASNRGNSVYFPSQVVPMLPEVLSNGLCSLRPEVDRLCLVCEMTISADGELSGYRHYEAVMRSHARLTYNEVAATLADHQGCLGTKHKPLQSHLKQLHRMYGALEDAREKRGTIAFDSPETKFTLNEWGKVIKMSSLVRNDAHKIIEECMILANSASAHLVERLKEPALYRVHKSPTEEQLTRARSFLNERGLKLEGGSCPSPSDYTRLLQKVKNRSDRELVHGTLLRTMNQAIYSADNQGHFGLSLKRYAHFTSPIRRYSDLLLHRSIKYLIAGKIGGAKEGVQVGSGYRYSANEVNHYGEKCSMIERRSEKAIREVSAWLKCEYMQGYLGKRLEGVITNVTSFGFFVRLTRLPVDGLVHISKLVSDYYHFDTKKQVLSGSRSGHIYRIGDAVRVKVLAVNLSDRYIDFKMDEASTGLIARRKGAGKQRKK